MLDNLQATENPVAEPEIKDRESEEHDVANDAGQMKFYVFVLHGWVQ